MARPMSQPHTHAGSGAGSWWYWRPVFPEIPALCSDRQRCIEAQEVTTSPLELSRILHMALPYLPVLANSHNGNCVLQAIVRFGTRLQQTQIWLSACPHLFVMCADPYGSRVVHTMLDFLPSNGADLEYIAFSISNCLSSNFSYFFKRSSGVRVITKCLRKLNHPCMKMATDQNGALLLQGSAFR
ncbi:armadillo-type protein [Favolaschia claudopus]|uniref:Armadillo-type protein n=1 Tax=Favolaschia claudopus TaxID=2862362 RepID=A0AAW0A1A1_9AGAR